MPKNMQAKLNTKYAICFYKEEFAQLFAYFYAFHNFNIFFLLPLARIKFKIKIFNIQAFINRTALEADATFVV